jgi:prefoldin subunit 5
MEKLQNVLSTVQQQMDVVQQQIAAVQKEKEENEKKFQNLQARVQQEYKGKITLDVGGKLHYLPYNTLF